MFTTSANPSEKDPARSNCGLITYFPVGLIYLNLPPICTRANPSEKDHARSNCGLITYFPVGLIYPYLPPRGRGKVPPSLPPMFTSANPSEKDHASSNCGLITNSPALLINPALPPSNSPFIIRPPISTHANPSEKSPASSNCGLITYFPVGLIYPTLSPISTRANASESTFAESDATDCSDPVFSESEHETRSVASIKNTIPNFVIRHLQVKSEGAPRRYAARQCAVIAPCESVPAGSVQASAGSPIRVATQHPRRCQQGTPTGTNMLSVCSVSSSHLLVTPTPGEK